MRSRRPVAPLSQTALVPWREIHLQSLLRHIDCEAFGRRPRNVLLIPELGVQELVQLGFLLSFRPRTLHHLASSSQEPCR